MSSQHRAAAGPIRRFVSRVTRLVGLLLALVSLTAPAVALEADGITGLPADVTPLLSMAGIWQPVGSIRVGLASTFSGNFTTDASGREHVIVTGWAFSPGSTTVIPVNFAIFQQQADGTMQLATSNFVSSSSTNGAGSVVIADFNGDGFPDIFLAGYNETPFQGAPSTALLSNGAGGFNKITLNDSSVAHDAELAMINGVPTVTTKSYQGGDNNPLYRFANGAFTEILPSLIAGAASGAIDQFSGPGQYEALVGDFIFGPGVPFVPPCCGDNPGLFQIAVYPFNGTDVGTQPNQLISGYFNSRSQYSNISSNWGPGNTHTYRLKIDDFNHDGSPDVIALGSLWNGNSQTYPAAIQMLQNNGTGSFTDVSDTLAANVDIQNDESDYTIQVRDLDGSGINSYASAAINFNSPPVNTANYLLVNDGSGLLHVGLFSQFTAWGNQVNAFLLKQLGINGHFTSMPKFILYKTASGRYNFLALATGSLGTSIPTLTTAYAAVNVPVQLDLTTMYTAPMTVQNRNGSHLIRTFAGNDTIFSGHDGGHAHVDGGLGTNTLVYSGNAADYQIATANGTTTVTDSMPNRDGTDELVNVQVLQFADTSMTIQSALTVSVTGSGTVTSSPPGINCSAAGGAGCNASFPIDAAVSLTESGGAFAGWSGACSGVGTCIVTMTTAESVTASFSTGAPPSSPLFAAVLPQSRSATVGNPVTAFATMLNTGTSAAQGCAIAPIGDPSLNFLYQTTNPTTNALAGTSNTPVNIAAATNSGPGAQTFVIALTPTAAFSPTQMQFSFACNNIAQAPIQNGVDTLLVSASATPVPDIVALAATTSNDGILHIPNGANAFAVASVNVGAGDTITVSANTGSASLPLNLTVCETNAQGTCKASPASTVATALAANGTPTFGIFAAVTGTIAFNPASSRVFVQFVDSTGTVRGLTSVAVETQ